MGPATLRRRKNVNDWTRGQLLSRTSLFAGSHTYVVANPDRNWAPEATITHSPLGPKLAPGVLHVCYAQGESLELGEEKLSETSGRARNSLVLSPC